MCQEILEWTGMLRSMQKECFYLLANWCSGATIFATIMNECYSSNKMQVPVNFESCCICGDSPVTDN